MPVEIKELHIKINVDEGRENTPQQPLTGSEKDKIIEACVEQVMEIIERKEER